MHFNPKYLFSDSYNLPYEFAKKKKPPIVLSMSNTESRKGSASDSLESLKRARIYKYRVDEWVTI